MILTTLLRPRVVYAVLLLGAAALALAILRPRAFFAEDGSLRPFGLRHEGGEAGATKTSNATVFAASNVLLCVAVAAYFLFTWLDLWRSAAELRRVLGERMAIRNMLFRP